MQEVDLTQCYIDTQWMFWRDLYVYLSIISMSTFSNTCAPRTAILSKASFELWYFQIGFTKRKLCVNLLMIVYSMRPYLLDKDFSNQTIHNAWHIVVRLLYFQTLAAGFLSTNKHLQQATELSFFRAQSYI